MQAVSPSRRHRADAPSAVDSGQLREVPRGETALTAVFVEAIESGRALCDEVNPIPAPGQRIPLSDPARSACLLRAPTLQEPWHGTLSGNATRREQAELMAKVAAPKTHAPGLSASW